MARVEVPITVLNSTTGLPVNGAAVAISHRSTGSPATWYPSESGGTASTAAVISDAQGRISAWVERGAYNLGVTGTGITPYTEPWDAVPGGDLSADVAWISDLALLPGEIKMFGGSGAPTGWLMCDGSQVSRTAYPRLWTAIGTNFGAGDGSTTFNLPDMRGRMPMGLGTGVGLTNRVIGTKAGAEQHTHTGNIPSHTHSGAAPDHWHSASGLYTGNHAHSVSGGTGAEFQGSLGRASGGGTCAPPGHTHGVSGTAAEVGNLGVYGTTAGSIHGLSFTTGGPSATAFTTANASEGMPPFAVVNFIIKT
jgi:microcystin-dependent protein